MAIGIALCFTAGRFHATQWGRHVNEGVPEWPPSPWRLLRALVAVWKRKLDGDSSCDVAVMRPLLEKLSVPPFFVLPRVGTGHTRHYMPTHDKPTKVFDVFVTLGKKDEFTFLWPDVTLTGQENFALSALLQNMNYFGRAESWCDARLLTDDEAMKARAKINCVPLRDQEVASNQEIVRALCADPVEAFRNEHTPRLKGKAGLPIYEPDWHLCMETLELHGQKWSDPPGAEWVPYLRETDCFSVQPNSTPRRNADRATTAARFVLDSPVLPLAQETLPVAELMRRHLMGTYRRIEETRLRDEGIEDFPIPRSETFSGKDDEGRPLEGHAHIYVLPTDEDEDGRLDHITVIAESGFDYSELMAIDRLRSLNRGPDLPKLNLVLVGLGQYSAMNAPLFAASTTWVSATPFLATRHSKARGKKRDRPELLGMQNRHLFTQVVLTEELARLANRRNDLPDIGSIIIEPIEDGRIGAHRLRPIQFKRSRAKRGDDGACRPAAALKIIFPAPVRGPICLGASAHFGMGLFFPDSH